MELRRVYTYLQDPSEKICAVWDQKPHLELEAIPETHYGVGQKKGNTPGGKHEGADQQQQSAQVSFNVALWKLERAGKHL